MRPVFWWACLPILACASQDRATPAAPEAPAAYPANSPEPAHPSSEQPLEAHGAPQTQTPQHAGQGADVHASGPAHHAEREHRHRSGYQMDFSEVERFAQHFDDPKRDAWQQPEEVVRLMNISAGQRVADIGAGTGYFVPYLSRAVGPTGKVLALDVELNMVRHLERRVRDQALRNVEPAHVPPGDPELAGGSVDRILIVNTWHHIGQRSAYAAKLARALKRGGSIWVVDFTLDSDIGPPSEHRLSPAQVATELSSAGLRAEIIRDEALPKQYVVQGSLVGDSE